MKNYIYNDDTEEIPIIIFSLSHKQIYLQITFKRRVILLSKCFKRYCCALIGHEQFIMFRATQVANSGKISNICTMYSSSFGRIWVRGRHEILQLQLTARHSTLRLDYRYKSIRVILKIAYRDYSK